MIEPAIVPTKAPNLPVAGPTYDQSYLNQILNTLRLYFVQIDNFSRVTTTVRYGTTAQRPAVGLTTGQQYFDTTLGSTISWNGTTWVASPLTSGAVSTFSGSTTGLTPATATSGAIALGGILNVINGGTGTTTSTGSGSVVLSAAPTLTGTAVASSISFGTLSGSTINSSTATGLTLACGTFTGAVINSSGIVTMPNQPAFWANNSGASWSSNYLTGISSAYFNVGNYFNLSTGTFTAPTSGVYMFWWNKYNNTQGSGAVIIQVNGNEKSYMDFNNNTPPIGTHLNLTLIYQLAANDSVRFYSSNTSFNAGDGNDFVGGCKIS